MPFSSSSVLFSLSFLCFPFSCLFLFKKGLYITPPFALDFVGRDAKSDHSLIIITFHSQWLLMKTLLFFLSFLFFPLWSFLPLFVFCHNHKVCARNVTAPFFGKARGMFGPKGKFFILFNLISNLLPLNYLVFSKMN